eukprot:XP_001702711.1 pseudouridine synthase [Chlamydomonas reinhardtii]
MARYLASRAWASSAAACTGLGGAEAAVGPGVWALLGLAGGASPSWRCIASQTPQAAAQQDKEQQHQEEPLSRHEAAPQPAQKRAGVPAMSWLRRRGPEVPHAVLYRLFRQRQVRLYDGDKVVRLLTPERVRRWVLGVQPGLVFINKPAGVRVHGRAAGDVDSAGGRDGGGPTLDSVMGEALRFGEQDEPKLVHRLDAQASGVMVVARNADAAAWLSAAFRGKSRQPRQSGRIRFPVAVDGSFYPAVSSYRVRGTGCGVTWVELTPETGLFSSTPSRSLAVRPSHLPFQVPCAPSIRSALAP